jgi:hypothetical protein
MNSGASQEPGHSLPRTDPETDTASDGSGAAADYEWRRWWAGG